MATLARERLSPPFSVPVRYSGKPGWKNVNVTVNVLNLTERAFDLKEIPNLRESTDNNSRNKLRIERQLNHELRQDLVRK